MVKIAGLTFREIRTGLFRNSLLLVLWVLCRFNAGEVDNLLLALQQHLHAWRHAWDKPQPKVTAYDVWRGQIVFWFMNATKCDLMTGVSNDHKNGRVN
jgi:hypothetical protein